MGCSNWSKFVTKLHNRQLLDRYKTFVIPVEYKRTELSLFKNRVGGIAINF